MNLLIITQKVDIDDDNLGFFHHWLEKIAKKVQKLYVICLYKGRYSLPQNVEVFSLGKERGPSRVKYIFNLYRYFFSLKGKIDLVFVHMNIIYIFLLWPFAKLFNLPIVLWKVHRGKMPHFDKAILLVDKIFTASEKSLDYETPKKIVVGHGIDTNIFKPNTSNLKPRTSNFYNVISIGRMSPCKNYEALIDAVNVLVNQRNFKNIEIKIIGGGSTKHQLEYYQTLKKKVKEYSLENYIHFLGSVPHRETVKYYQECDLFVNFLKTAGLDKALLEAMACGKLICTCQETLAPFLGEYKEKLMVSAKDPEETASKIIELLSLDSKTKEKITRYLREVVVKNHNLDNLVERLIIQFQNLLNKKAYARK